MSECDLGTGSERQLQACYGTTQRAQAFRRNQVIGELNTDMVAFIERQWMLVLATADASGATDASPRFGPAGFVRVLRDGSLAYPEYRGNGVLASLANIAENPHATFLFVDFEHGKIGLHVNGEARVIDNGAMSRHEARTPAVVADLAVAGGRRPERWVLLDVREAYIHCSKHIPLMRRLTPDEEIAWGTDDVRAKGGDHFRVAARRRAGPAPV